MKIYKELAALRCFTHADMVRLTGSESAAQWQTLQKSSADRFLRVLE